MESQKPGQTDTAEAEPRIDGYEIIERLGQGGTASVWKARQVSLQRLVVIKVLSEQFARDVADIKQFRLEARLAANLKHSGIVQVYDFGQSREDRRYYFVMEYISGYSVGEWMRRKQILPEPDALVVVHSVAAVLRYAWDSARIVHCDLKPDNIMVDGDGTIKLTDLGLAQVVSNIGLAAGRPDEFVTGTPNYMSPEQVRGNAKLDCRSDIYALGMTSFHMLTGQLPFAGAAPADVMEKQLSEPLPHLREVNPAVSSGAAQLVARMTAKLPDDRYQTWDAVLEAVAALEKPAAAPAPAPAPVPAPVPAAAQPPAVHPPAVCPHCGSSIRANAAFCRHCGKQLPGSPGATAKPGVRLRMAAPKPKPEVAAPASLNPVRARWPSRRISHAWISGMMGNLRMVLSVVLLVFLAYCGYQRIVKDRDVIWPLRVKIQRVCGEAWHKARLGMAEFFERRPAPVEPAGEDAGMLLPPPKTPARPGPASPDKSLPEQESSYSGWRPASATQPAAAAEPEQAQEYARLLELCRSSMPRVGEKVVIDLQHQAAKREGTLQEIGREGLVLQIESGQLTVPYDVMAPEFRLRFFPEERARHLLQRAARAP